MPHYYLKYSVALNFGIMCTMCTGTVNIAAINSTCTTAMFEQLKYKWQVMSMKCFRHNRLLLG